MVLVNVNEGLTAYFADMLQLKRFGLSEQAVYSYSDRYFIEREKVVEEREGESKLNELLFTIQLKHEIKIP